MALTLALSSLVVPVVPAVPRRNAIRVDVSSLPSLDRQTLRTMLRTLETRLSAYFCVVDAGESELAIVDGSSAEHFALRAANGTQLALPRPLRLMPLADALNAMIEAVRPATFDFDAAREDTTTLSGLVSRTAMTPVRATGAWGETVIDPASDLVAFDKPLEFVARALAVDDDVAHAAPIENVARATSAARCVLRRDEVLWLSRTDPELQRVVGSRLARNDLILKITVWPNLARIPGHPRWLGVFAALQSGVAASDLIRLTTEAGIAEPEARRGIAMLIRARHLRIETVRAEAPAKPATPQRPPSFLAQLKSKLLQFVEREATSSRIPT